MAFKPGNAAEKRSTEMTAALFGSGFRLSSALSLCDRGTGLHYYLSMDGKIRSVLFNGIESSVEYSHVRIEFN